MSVFEPLPNSHQGAPAAAFPEQVGQKVFVLIKDVILSGDLRSAFVVVEVL